MITCTLLPRPRKPNFWCGCGDYRCYQRVTRMDGWLTLSPNGTNTNHITHANTISHTHVSNVSHTSTIVRSWGVPGSAHFYAARLGKIFTFAQRLVNCFAVPGATVYLNTLSTSTVSGAIRFLLLPSTRSVPPF